MPENGFRTVSSTDYEGQVIYSCNAGYELESGNPTVTRTCLIDGTWSGEDPTCVRKYIHSEGLTSLQWGGGGGEIVL